MNDRNSHESTKRIAKWLTVSLGATLLMCPLKGAAQSKPEADSKRETAPAVSAPSLPNPIKTERTAGGSASQQAKVVLATFHPTATAGRRSSSRESEPETKTVRIWDACDPASFDAAVKPGTCKPGHHGQTNFLDFIAELQTDKIAGGWRFNPLLNTTEGVFKLTRLELQPGDRISLENAGGETHTFTRVEEFGGGFFAPLNSLTDNVTPAPECARILADGSLAPQPESDTNEFVEAGETEAGPIAGTPVLPLGVTHWQCCVHPWMRINVAVHDQHDHDHQP